MKKLFFLNAALLCCFVNVFSQAGSLDPAFGVGGYVYTNMFNVKNGNENFYAMAIQDDGKIIIVGNTYSPNVILRYNTDGSLDNSFGGDGIIFFYELSLTAMALQDDGKIVVAGYIYNGSNLDIVLLRYNTDGSLDNSFDGDGKQITPVGSSDDYATSIAVQSDGKILAAGYSSVGSTADFALARFNTDGSLDNSFDMDGRLTTPIGASDDRAYSIAVQNDGKIVVAGYSLNGSNADFALTRFNADGSLDNSFDMDGRLTTPIGASDDHAYSIAIQSDNKIVVAGHSLNGSNADFALARYNTDGSLDNSFDMDGWLTTDIGSSEDYATSIAIQSDDKIVVAGHSINEGNYDFTIARYNTDGSLDNSFDLDGWLTTAFGTSDEYARSIALQSDGMIIVAGVSYTGDYSSFAVGRYNTNGSLDNSFDLDGKLTTGFASSPDNAYCIAIQNDGKIVMAGFSENGSNYDFALARYNTDGSLDNSFDDDGRLTTPGTTDDWANAIAIQSDGKIVVAGFQFNGTNQDLAISRYNTDGSLDIGFDDDGKLTTPVGAFDDVVNAIAIQSDGKIVVAGNSSNGSNWDIVLARYNTDGSLDNSFDGDGKLTTPVSAVSNDYANAIAIQSDGKIVVAGYTNIGSTDDFALLRYNTDGSPDNSFSGDGKQFTPVGAATDDYGKAIAIQSDDKILVAGYSNWDFALARYNIDGSPDNSFSGDGKQTTPIGSFQDVASSIAIQSDGKILVAGYSYNGRNDDFSLARFNADGSPDNNFDGDGKAVYDLAKGSHEYIMGMQLFSNRIYLAGMMITEGAGDFALAAILNDGFPLPLQLLDFSGKWINNDALLNWKTENEENTSHFEIQRSLDGRSYLAIGELRSVNSPGIHRYSFIDAESNSLDAPVIYYRLKLVDIDGKFTYSRIVALPLDKNRNLVLLYPNPVINEANLTITVSRPEHVLVSITDNAGRLVLQHQWKLSEGGNSLSVDLSRLAKGAYCLELKGDNTRYNKQFVKH